MISITNIFEFHQFQKGFHPKEQPALKLNKKLSNEQKQLFKDKMSNHKNKKIYEFISNPLKITLKKKLNTTTIKKNNANNQISQTEKDRLNKLRGIK